MSRTKFIVNILFLFTLLPYISPYPLGSDVQIWPGLIAFLIIASLTITNGLYLDNREVLFLGLAILFVFYLNLDESTYEFRKAIGPLYAFGIFYVVKRYNFHFDQRTVFLAMLGLFLAGIVQIISPTAFNNSLEHFIRLSKYTEEGARGITSMTPEPSFLGIVSIFSLIISTLIYNRDHQRYRYFYYFNVFACIFLTVASRSGTGYVLLFLYVVYYFRELILKYIWRTGLIAVLVLFIVFAFDFRIITENKGIIELSRLMEMLINLEFSAILHAQSLSVRLNPLIVGWYGFIDNPLGNGSGSFGSYAVDVYYKYEINELYPLSVRSRLAYRISEVSISTFGKYVFEYGIFFLIFLWNIARGIDYSRINLFVIFLIVTSLMFSLPIVYPPLWVILALFDKRSQYDYRF